MRDKRTTIRQLAVGPGGNVLAAGESKRVVHLYNLTTTEHMLTVETTLDFGGRRLAIANDGGTVVAGAYHVDGIAAYSGVNGQELWRRKDLKKVQYIAFGADDTNLFCAFEGGPGQTLNATTGQSGGSFRGVRKAWESPYTAVRLFDGPRDYQLDDAGGSKMRLPRESFATLSAAFSPTLVCISEVGGPVRSFDLRSGAEAWRFTPPEGVHFLRLAFCDQLRAFAGVSWPFQTGGDLCLYLFDANRGIATRIADVGQGAEVAFCRGGTELVTADGSIFDVATGKRVRSLPFPARSELGSAR